MRENVEFDLDADGYLRLPTGTRRIWVDVGADTRSFTGTDGVYSHSFFAGRPSLHDEAVSRESSDLAFIAIDANADYRSELSALPRTSAIIAAIDLSEGTTRFNDYGGPGCSSILKPNENLVAEGMDKSHPCRVVIRTRGVAVLRLETVLRLVPPSVRIELVKVDAQGVDLAVAQSAGDQLRRIERIILEMQRVTPGSQSLLYSGQETSADAHAWMTAHGFLYDPELSYVENPSIGEANELFINSASLAPL